MEESNGKRLWNWGWDVPQMVRNFMGKLAVVPRYEGQECTLYPNQGHVRAPPLGDCLEWWMSLFEDGQPDPEARFPRCLRTRLVHVVNRVRMTTVLDALGSRAFVKCAFESVLKVLEGLPQPTSLIWLVTAAYPHDMGPNSRVPFSKTGIGGQLWGMLKRKQPTEEPIWPVCSLGTDSANRDVHEQICLPLALAVTRGIVDSDTVTRVVKRSFVRGKVADADKETEAALHGCLQRFHVTLAMMWSMAVAVNHDRDFQVMLTSLEILLAASLLSKIKLPPAFAEDIFLYLFSSVQLLGLRGRPGPSGLRTRHRGGGRRL